MTQFTINLAGTQAATAGIKQLGQALAEEAAKHKANYHALAESGTGAVVESAGSYGVMVDKAVRDVQETLLLLAQHANSTAENAITIDTNFAAKLA